MLAAQASACWTVSTSCEKCSSNVLTSAHRQQEEIAGKDEPALRRLLNENEEVARQRDALKKRLELMERAAAEIMHFRV